MNKVKAIVLAGGKGTRMKSNLPKVLHKVYDRCIIDYVCDACEDAEWIDVRVIRAPALDGAYRGLWEMDWFNAEDRVALVRDANFVCSYEMDYADCDCDQCPATEFCGRYESMHEDGE